MVVRVVRARPRSLRPGVARAAARARNRAVPRTEHVLEVVRAGARALRPRAVRPSARSRNAATAQPPHPFVGRVRARARWLVPLSDIGAAGGRDREMGRCAEFAELVSAWHVVGTRAWGALERHLDFRLAGNGPLGRRPDGRQRGRPHRRGRRPVGGRHPSCVDRIGSLLLLASTP